MGGEDILVLAQVSQMSAALLAGFFGGIAFDLYQRLCYGTTKRRRRPTAYLKGDLIFGIILIGLWLLFWFTCTDGSIRVSVFIWLVVGAILYFGIFRQKVSALIHKLPRRQKESQGKLSPKQHPRKQIDLIDKGSDMLIGCYHAGSRITGTLKGKIAHIKSARKEKEQ